MNAAVVNVFAGTADPSTIVSDSQAAAELE
jgi:hypothetical protein